MRRLLSFTAPALVALALPALAQAQTGTVLSAAQSRHQVQVIGANKVVSAYSFSGNLRRFHRGTKLSFATNGSRITAAKPLGTAKSFSFLGTVVQSGRGALVLSLGDSQRLRLSAKQISHPPTARIARMSAKSVTVQINGLQAGESVVITETTDSAGNVTITITLPSGVSGSAGGSSSGSGSGLSAIGLVNNVGTSTFDVITSSGADLTFHMNAQVLADDDVDPCDEVVVDYSGSGQTLTASDVDDNGPPDSGPCSSGGDDSNDWIGTITAVSATSVTVDAGLGNGGVSTFFVDDPAITDGFLVGDSVDVTYEPWNGHSAADQISYNDTETSGVVTAINAAGTGFETVSMIDDYTADAETFYVPVDLLQGEDVQLGDELDVSYYQAARGLTLDSLDDDGPAGD